jgi:hypothetical protein
VIAATVTTAAKMKDFMDTLASRVARKLDGGPRRRHRGIWHGVDLVSERYPQLPPECHA